MSSKKNYGTILFSDLRVQNILKSIKLDNTSHQEILKINVPSSFDGRIVWKDYIYPIEDQLSCISCWAFTTLFSLACRLSIYTKGHYKEPLSKAKIIFQKNNLVWSDVKENLSKGIPFDIYTKAKNEQINECSENSIIETWQYIYSFGVPEEKCVDDKTKITSLFKGQYLFGDTYDECPNTGENMIHHRIGGYYYVPATQSKSILFPSGTEENIRREIYHWGPCVSAMRVFDDFLNWDGKGIYIWDGISKETKNVGHSIVLIGWGEDNGVPYWLCRNTWGEEWGEKGYFKIIRGVNMCEIEENVFVGYPTLPAIKLYIEHPILYRFDDFILRGKWGILDNGYKITTYEKMMKRDKKAKKIPDFIYDLKYWPNFSKLIAAELETIEFKNKLVESFGIYTVKNNSVDYVIYFLIFLIVLKILNKKKF